MAVANIKDLWELAVTLMGGNAAAEIVDPNTDMSNPTTPIELTLDQVYEPMRKSVLQEANWNFARKYADLRKGPTAEHDGSDPEWDLGGRWSYLYRIPSDCLQFLGFVRDYPDLELVRPYEVRPIPVKYEVITSTSVSNGIYTFTTGLPAGGVIYRGGVHAEFEDELGTKFNLVDYFWGEVEYYYDFTFKLEELGTAYGTGNASEVWDYSNTASTKDINVAWWTDVPPAPTFDSLAYPATLDVTLAVRAPTDDDWTDHIFTNQDDARGAYVFDAQDPSDWPDQFQMYLATLLAQRLAVVHAKSSRQIEILAQQVSVARSAAITDLCNDQGTLFNTRAYSTSEQARW